MFIFSKTAFRYCYMKSESLLVWRLGNVFFVCGFFFFLLVNQTNADNREKEEYVLQIKSLTYKDITM